MKNRNRNPFSFVVLTVLALVAIGGCATTAVQQAKQDPMAQLRQDARDAFGDLRQEEDRSERRADGCRSNGDATADDAEDCEVVNDDE